MKSTYEDTDYIITRIREEFQVLQSLKHENIIGFEDS